MTTLREMLLERAVSQKERLGCLMAMIDESVCSKILEFNHKLIKEEDLYHKLNDKGEDEFGREKECHVTIRYGFTKDLNELEIRKLLAGQNEFSVEINGLDIFDTNPEFDVVKFNVSSPILNRLNSMSQIYPNKSDFPEYHAHFTLAYVKKGTFPHKKAISMELPITSICYSPITGAKSYFPLDGGNTDMDVDARILKLNENVDEWISHGIAINRTPDSKLRATPGGQNDGAPGWNEGVGDWDGIIEGKDWFCYVEGNDWHNKESGASVYIAEDDSPYKISIKIKTHGLRKKGDTNESFKERIRKHAHKVSRTWMSAAKDIHNNTEINEVGNVVPVTWKHAFKEALNDPKVKSLISGSNEKDLTPVADPVNFTPRTEQKVMKPKTEKISYSAVLLMKQDQEKLKQIFDDKKPSGWTTFAHHMTICMGELSETQKADIGKTVTLTCTEFGQSLTNIALKVTGYSSTNTIPHITLFVNMNEGGKPVDSNKITDWKVLSQPITVQGMVKEFPFKN